MRRWLARYENLIMIAVLIGLFIAVGVYFLQRKDMSMGVWKTNFSKSAIDMDQLIDGGMGRDGILPIDDPVFVPVADIDWLGDRSPVILLEMSDPVRAYPLAVLMRHEIVNDEIDGLPIAVTFCPLCYSPVVYERQIEGEPLRLGVTGYLYKSGFIMWDDKTESWWTQFTGTAIVGDYTGQMLPMVASQVVGYETFAERYPDGIVLVGDRNQPDMMYGRNPYINYDSSNMPFMFDGNPDDRMASTGWVLTAVVGDQPVAYPYTLLAQDVVINHTVDDVPVVAFWKIGLASPLDAAEINESRETGMAALFSPVVDGQVLTFRHEDDTITDEQTGSTWNIYGEAVAGPLMGAELAYMDCSPRLWFAWAETHPDTIVYGY